MYVMTPYTSLLVLENEEMYNRFKVDRGRKDHWAPYTTPAQVDVVYEPRDGERVDVRFAPKTEKPHANQILDTVLVRMPPTMIVWPNRQQPYRGMMVTTALHIYRGAFALPGMPLSSTPANGGDLYFGFAADPDSPIGVEGVIKTPSISQVGSVILAGKNEYRRGDDGLAVLAAFAPPAQNGKRRPGGFSGRSGATRERMLRHGGGFGAGEFRGNELAPDGDMLGMDLTPRREKQQSAQDAIFKDIEQSEVLKKLKGKDGQWGLKGDDRPDPFALADGGLALLAGGHISGPSMYNRPSFSQEERVFFDLMAYAPGLNTSAADVEAVKDAEAAPGLESLPGQIDPAARKLVEAARTGGWRTLHLGKGEDGYTLVFDGQGRYAYERTLSLGLREIVVCDGQKLLHLYPELGLGARRSMSRFHRAQLAEVVSWLVPPAEDLARGGDLRLLKDRTVVIVPRGAEAARDDDGKPMPYVCVQLVFAADGSLAERRIVEMPSDKVLFRETYDPAAGLIRLLNADGKELSKRELKLREGREPNLAPDTARLVVLPLPYRTQHQVYLQCGVNRGLLYNRNENWTFEYLDADAALALFTAEFAAGDYQAARQVYKLCFAANGVRKLGFFTVLATGNVPVSGDADFHRLWTENPSDPLAAYLALHLNPRYHSWQQDWPLHIGDAVGTEDSFLRRLSVFHDLFLRWRSGHANLGSERSRQAEQERAYAFIRKNKGNVLGWALLSLVQDRADEGKFHRAVAGLWKEIDAGGDLSYIAQYEHARGLRRAGEKKLAAENFGKLYEKTLKAGVLPSIDSDFRDALQGDGSDLGWTNLVRDTAAALLKDKHRVAVVHLAWQCWQLGDATLSQNLLDEALKAPADDAERLEVSVAALEFLMGTNQYPQADARLLPLLQDAKFAKRPMLWRVGSQIAAQRQMIDRSIFCLETALDLEYQAHPSVVDLQQVRNDYGRLLNHYDWLAGAVGVMKIDPPADLLPRTVRAADRWRALDRDNSQPCDQAARVLKVLGARDLAWDYMTTPIALRPNESSPWSGLAHSLSYQGDLDLADLAWKSAFEAEPTDAQLLWDRAQNARRAGKLADAQKYLRQITDGKWQPRFNWLKSQAEWQLTGR
jgi:hypothetical protein